MKFRILAFILILAVAGACVPKQDVDLRETVTRAELDSVAEPVLLAEIPSVPAQSMLLVWGRNGPVTTWRTGENVSLSFNDGVLVATRGLGHDLASADVSGTLRALAANDIRPYDRFASFIAADAAITVLAFRCTMGPSDRSMIDLIGLAIEVDRREETCRNDADTITNIYWSGPDAFIWRSRQWVSPEISYLITERLVR